MWGEQLVENKEAVKQISEGVQVIPVGNRYRDQDTDVSFTSFQLLRHVTNCTAVTLTVDRVYIDNSNYYCSLLDALRAVCTDAAIDEFCIHRRGDTMDARLLQILSQKHAAPSNQERKLHRVTTPHQTQY